MTSQYVTPPGAPNPPPGPYLPQGGYGHVPPPTPPPRKRGLLAIAGLVTAILLATAALVVGIIALNRPTSDALPSSPNRTPAVASPTTKPTDTPTADRRLCEAVAPLIRENADAGKGFVNLGPSGTPARDAGIPQYQDAVSDWVNRIQPIVDQHPDADPFFRRTLQRFIDDSRIYAASIRRGPENDADAAAWNDKLVAIGGPFEICHGLGVQW
jgi:hypothetical protein